jgi:hypothetical protein
VRWRSPNGGPAEAHTQIVATDAEPSDDLGLATTVADLAQLVKGDPAYTQRGVTLDDLAARAAELQQDDVPGADRLAELIGEVSRDR